MRTRTIVVAAAVATGLFVTGAVAQHEEHHDQAAPPAGKADTGKMGGMMSGNMMTQMPKMMMGQTETGKLVDQLAQSFIAIEAEKDPAALKAKFAEHDALLKELQTKVQAQSHMMDMMQHMMGVMMGGTQTGGEGKK
jgi:hypothetical protein